MRHLVLLVVLALLGFTGSSRAEESEVPKQLLEPIQLSYLTLVEQLKGLREAEGNPEQDAFARRVVMEFLDEWQATVERQLSFLLLLNQEIGLKEPTSGKPLFEVQYVAFAEVVKDRIAMERSSMVDATYERAVVFARDLEYIDVFSYYFLVFPSEQSKQLSSLDERIGRIPIHIEQALKRTESTVSARKMFSAAFAEARRGKLGAAIKQIFQFLGMKAYPVLRRMFLRSVIFSCTILERLAELPGKISSVLPRVVKAIKADKKLALFMPMSVAVFYSGTLKNVGEAQKTFLYYLRQE
ncbi:MAG: hypothetical protein A2284_04535 [Deltaproteobacteria bacterium RIFOXYA12_FULL_61_11]|nr:MAG: hypothetical protein A2284_04535 [Deltaproteobacteria bacterium RIFOXYA12_FULL_61_11]